MSTNITRYGVSHPDVIPLNTKKRVLMPVWAENEQNEMIFAGWFVPQEVQVVDGTAEVQAGPSHSVIMPDGFSNTTPQYYDVVLNTSGEVSLRCILTDGSTTLDVVQSFQVGGDE